MAVDYSQLHIDAPELLSRRRRLGDALATGFMWIIYSYLWAPLVSLLAWLLGFEFAYDVMIRAGGIHMLLESLSWYGKMLIAIIVCVTGWSLLNRYRFAKLSRRCKAPIVGDEDISDFYGISAEQIDALRTKQIMRLTVSEDGHIEQVADREQQISVTDHAIGRAHN
jgi:biofilm PGA synthesis protein PgaD